jgi:hypothetical protein
MDMDDKLFAAYKNAIDARNFHYDSYNKWMTFYYVAIGAVSLTFYGADKEKISDDLFLLLSFVGLVISVLWHLSCKGYYLWVHHWITIIKRFEEKLEKELHVYSIIDKKAKNSGNLLVPIRHANISTSKATLLFSYIVSLSWAWVFVDQFCYIIWYWHLIATLLLLSLLIFGLGKLLKSDFNNLTEV